jgi:hypothetical protein
VHVENDKAEIECYSWPLAPIAGWRDFRRFICAQTVIRWSEEDQAGKADCRRSRKRRTEGSRSRPIATS